MNDAYKNKYLLNVSIYEWGGDAQLGVWMNRGSYVSIPIGGCMKFCIIGLVKNPNMC